MTHSPSPLRVAMLSVHTSPLADLGGKKTGGMNVYIYNAAHELAQQGVHVDIYTRASQPDVPRVQTAVNFNGRVINLPAGPYDTSSVADLEQYLPQFTAELVAFAQQENIQYDIIHSHYWLSGLVALQLRAHWYPAIPIIHMFHTLGHMKNRIAPNSHHQAPPARIAGETTVINGVDHIIAATPAEKIQLRWLYGANTDK
ncbi:MAG TPA: glycosyltransferase, partial [Anaerolineae bacterium]|nr:glycosyltransferase [Anaerolineae bacterium]